MIRKEARPFYRTISGVRLCWELEEPKGPDRASFPFLRSVWSQSSVHVRRSFEKRGGGRQTSMPEEDPQGGGVCSCAIDLRFFIMVFGCP